MFSDYKEFIGARYSSAREGGSFSSEEPQEFLDICIVIEGCMERLMKVVPAKNKRNFSPGCVENIRSFIDKSLETEKLDLNKDPEEIERLGSQKLDALYTQIYKLVIDKYSIPLLERRDLLRSVYAYLVETGEAVE